MPSTLDRGRVKMARPLPADLATGAAAGLFAGAVLLIGLAVVFSLFEAVPAWYPIQVIGSLVYGPAALSAFDPAVLLTGITLHLFGPALIWGLVFGALVNLVGPTRVEGWELLGLFVGAASQVIDVYILAPAVFTVVQGQDLWAASIPDGWSWALHLMYGVALGIFPWRERRD